MTRSIWDDMMAKRDSAPAENVEPVRDPDYERPTYDEWLRDEERRRFAADVRHAGDRDRVHHGY